MSETQELPSHKLCLWSQVHAVIVAADVISAQKNDHLSANKTDKKSQVWCNLPCETPGLQLQDKLYNVNLQHIQIKIQVLQREFISFIRSTTVGGKKSTGFSA